MTEETRQEKINRLIIDAKIIKETYNKKVEHQLLIAGKFTLTEMFEWKNFYKKVGDLFIPFDTALDENEYFPDFDRNITEFFAFMMMTEEEICKFLIDKNNITPLDI